MKRTQIQLTEKQAEELKRMAAIRGVSMAELIRQSVEMLLNSSKSVGLEERRRRALSVIGRFRSGITDLSERHDKHLAEAYEK
ncbi:MAG: CopG family transcriptional regulator [Pseudomonadota bacterium]